MKLLDIKNILDADLLCGENMLDYDVNDFLSKYEGFAVYGKFRCPLC